MSAEAALARAKLIAHYGDASASKKKLGGGGSASAAYGGGGKKAASFVNQPDIVRLGK